MYSAQLLDHFQNPRNAGEIADADAVSEIENPACGDILRLSLKVSADRITQTLEKARALLREDVSAAVGGLPQASTHAAQLALDALSAALSQIKQ